MELAKIQTTISGEQYLEMTRDSDERMEFLDGEIIAMAGGSKAHGLITASITRQVGNLLAGRPCCASTSISVSASHSYLIPDLVIYCGGGSFTTRDDILQDPVVIFEVLSNSTEHRDRGPKWMHYQQIESLKHYVLISQDSPTVETFTREPNGWHYESITGLHKEVTLSQVGITISLTDIFERVEFPTESDKRQSE